MSVRFTVRFAGLDIGVESRFASVRELYGSYLSDAPPVFSVRADGAAVRRQRALSEDPVTEEYAEALVLYREMAEILPLYDRAVFHGAAIEYDGKAYLFTGPSGIGKSTHIALWRQYLGERVRIINGDKPVLHREDGGITVCGTPYAGKEGWQRNTSAKLFGICFLTREGEKTARPLPPEEAFLRLFAQTYRPQSEAAMLKTIEILRALCAVPCFTMARDKTAAAVRASFAALTGTNEWEA